METSLEEILCPRCRESIRRWAVAKFAAKRAPSHVVRLAGVAVPEIRPEALLAQVVEWGRDDVFEMIGEQGQ